MRYFLLAAALTVATPALAGEHIPGRPYLHNHQYLARSCESIDFHIDKTQCYQRATQQIDAATSQGISQTIQAMRGYPHYQSWWADNLRRAQAAWQSYRKAECDGAIRVYFGGAMSGSSMGVSIAQCRYDKALRRALEVQRHG